MKKLILPASRFDRDWSDRHFSRGGFIGLVCVSAVLAWRLARSNKFLIIAGLPLVLVAFLLFAPSGYKSRIASTTDDSGIARREELKRSLFVALHHPLFGVGMNNYIIYSDVNHATHNAYTQVASELGFPALFLYIMFLVTPLRGIRRIGRETSDRRRLSGHYYLAVGMEASLIGYMVSSFFLSVAYLWYVYYLVGYAICFRRLYDAGQSEEAHPAILAGDVQHANSPKGRTLVSGFESPASARTSMTLSTAAQFIFGPARRCSIPMPAILCCFHWRLRYARDRSGALIGLPSVTVIISAYNEELDLEGSSRTRSSLIIRKSFLR